MVTNTSAQSGSASSVCINPKCGERLSPSNTANGCRRCINEAHRSFKMASLGNKKQAKEWYRFVSAKKKVVRPQRIPSNRSEMAHVSRRLKEITRSRGDKAVITEMTRKQTNGYLFDHTHFQKLRENEVKRRSKYGRGWKSQEKKV